MQAPAIHNSSSTSQAAVGGGGDVNARRSLTNLFVTAAPEPQVAVWREHSDTMKSAEVSAITIFSPACVIALIVLGRGS